MWNPPPVLWPTPIAQGTPPKVPADPDEAPDAYTSACSMRMAVRRVNLGHCESYRELYMGRDGDEEEDDDDGDDDDLMPKLSRRTLPLAAFLSFTNVNQQSQSPLFQLPCEIRATIWELVTATYFDPNRQYDRRLHLWRPDNTGPRRVDTALLLTCRAAYSEAWDLPLRQTLLVISEGSESDRPCWEFSYPVNYDVSLPFLQPWQILLIRNMDMTMRQQQLETGGIARWTGEFGHVRSKAGGMVSYFAQENEGKLHQDVVQKIFNSPIREMTVRLNRRDWWKWESKPPRENKDEDTKMTSEAKTLHLDNVAPTGWTKIPGLLAKDFQFNLVLETFGAKKSQLDHVASQAQAWVFQAPLGINQSTKKKLVWNGKKTDESWDQVRPEVFKWMKKSPWKETATRVEVRRLKYVLSEVDE